MAEGKIKLLVFDLDGTLIDSGTDLARAVNHVLAFFKLPKKSKETILSYIGDGEEVLMSRALGERGTDRHREGMAIFYRYYEDHLLDNTSLYPGVKDMLEAFAGTRKIIVTNKTFRFAVKIASHLNIIGYFEEIVGIDNSPYRKPDGNLIRWLEERYSVKSGEICVIGDGVADIRLAKNGKAVSCAFLKGLTNRSLLTVHNPDLVYEDPSAIPSLLESYRPGDESFIPCSV